MTNKLIIETPPHKLSTSTVQEQLIARLVHNQQNHFDMSSIWKQIYSLFLLKKIIIMQKKQNKTSKQNSFQTKKDPWKYILQSCDVKTQH